jgi:hypothetical protein
LNGRTITVCGGRFFLWRMMMKHFLGVSLMAAEAETVRLRFPGQEACP